MTSVDTLTKVLKVEFFFSSIEIYIKVRLHTFLISDSLLFTRVCAEKQLSAVKLVARQRRSVNGKQNPRSKTDPVDKFLESEQATESDGGHLCSNSFKCEERRFPRRRDGRDSDRTALQRITAMFAVLFFGEHLRWKVNRRQAPTNFQESSILFATFVRLCLVVVSRSRTKLLSL